MVFLQFHYALYRNSFLEYSAATRELRIQLLLWQKKTNLAPACLSLILNYEITSAKLTSSFLAFNNEQTGRADISWRWMKHEIVSVWQTQSTMFAAQCLMHNDNVSSAVQHNVWCTMLAAHAFGMTAAFVNISMHIVMNRIYCWNATLQCWTLNIMKYIHWKKYLWTKLYSEESRKAWKMQ